MSQSNPWANKNGLANISKPSPTSEAKPKSEVRWVKRTVLPTMNSLPASITINGQTWFRTSSLSQNRTFCYLQAPSSAVADTMITISDHITVVGNAHNVILNIHFSTAGSEVITSRIQDPLNAMPPFDCDAELLHAFYQLFMRRVVYSEQPTSSPISNNNNNSGSGGNGGFPPLGATQTT